MTASPPPPSLPSARGLARWGDVRRAFEKLLATRVQIEGHSVIRGAHGLFFHPQAATAAAHVREIDAEIEAASDEVYAPAHGLITADEVIPLNLGANNGLTAGQSYYAIIVSEDVIKLALTAADAIFDNAVNILQDDSSVTLITAVKPFHVSGSGSSVRMEPGIVAGPVLMLPTWDGGKAVYDGPVEFQTLGLSNADLYLVIEVEPLVSKQEYIEPVTAIAHDFYALTGIRGIECRLVFAGEVTDTAATPRWNSTTGEIESGRVIVPIASIVATVPPVITQHWKNSGMALSVIPVVSDTYPALMAGWNDIALTITE